MNFRKYILFLITSGEKCNNITDVPSPGEQTYRDLPSLRSEFHLRTTTRATPEDASAMKLADLLDEL